MEKEPRSLNYPMIGSSVFIYHFRKMRDFTFDNRINTDILVKGGRLMDWSSCVGMLQKYLEKPPLIVLGSGVSIPYGLPSMGGLAEELKKSEAVISDPCYNSFCEAIDNKGLEGAIDSVNLLHKTLDEIRRLIWGMVNEKDLLFFRQNLIAPPCDLVLLIEKVLGPTPNKAVVVTTNYDRLAEYAADGLGATTVTGFEGSLIKKFEPPSDQLRIKRIRARERTVEIWKPHGSLDWFISPNGKIVSFPLTSIIPSTFEPLIIPPGKEKYSATHQEPFRTIISEADKAFVNASSYLCIGYGFNDDHIQPKLLEQVSGGKPIVILAMAMTPACKKHIIDAGIKKYLIFESADSHHAITKVHGNGWEATYEGRYWSLDNFLKIW